MTNLGADNLFQNNGEARKVIKIKGEYEISFDMLKVPTLNIKKLDEKLDELENIVELEKNKVEDLYRQKEECRRELEKPFEFQEKLDELLKRKNEIDNELRLDEDKTIQVAEEEEKEEMNEQDFEEYSEDEEEEEYEEWFENSIYKSKATNTRKR